MEDKKLKPEENRKFGAEFFENKKMVLVFVLVLVASLAFVGYTWRQKEVFLVVDGQKLSTKTFASTVDELIKQKNIKLNDKDRLIPEANTKLKDGIQVVIKRAVPVVITVDNQKVEVLSSAETVKELIGEQNIKLNKLDQVSPGLQKKLESDMEIKIVRVEQKIEEKEIPIAFATVRKQNPNLASGLTREETSGKNGLEKQVWQITYQDGKEVNRKIIDRQIISQPVNRVIQVGTQQQIASRGGTSFRYSNVLNMVASAYTYTGNNTASGVAPHVGVVAVDPRVIPMGTRLYIEGYGYATAMDTGGAIKGNRIDLFMSSSQQCRNWGIRNVKVYVLQ
ncbi:3D domain-containing protein [Desulfolucanica intricata]|uniref:3D domain-containing protein n=1 Tax=Desulfolucanica intricata TaxID=1285191 RepID=UPI00082EAEE3|nr:3D domain-containing protein [Desulfolucanica intricata]